MFRLRKTLNMLASKEGSHTALGALRGEPAARRLPPLRYGFTLDGKRAEEGLGFRPAYRVGMARAGDGRLRLETSAV